MIKHLFVSCCLFVSLSVSAQDPNTEKGSLFFSRNEGVSWERVDNRLPADVVVNEITETEGSVLIATEQYGIFVSTDHLQSWHSLNQGLPVKKVDALIQHEGDIYAGTYKRGVYKLDETSTTWQPMNVGLTDLTIRVFHSYQNILLAGTNDGLFVWLGGSWKKLMDGLQINDVTEVDNKVFVATNRGVSVSSFSLDNWKMTLKDTAIHRFLKFGSQLTALTYFGGWLGVNESGKVRIAFTSHIPQPGIQFVVSIEHYLLAWMQTGWYKSYDGGIFWQKIPSKGMDSPGEKIIRKIKSGWVAGVGKATC